MLEGAPLDLEAAFRTKRRNGAVRSGVWANVLDELLTKTRALGYRTLSNSARIPLDRARAYQ